MLVQFQFLQEKMRCCCVNGIDIFTSETADSCAKILNRFAIDEKDFDSNNPPSPPLPINSIWLQLLYPQDEKISQEKGIVAKCLSSS